MEHYQTLNRKLKWGLVWGLFLSASLVHAGPTPAPTPPKLITMLERGRDNGRMHIGEENRGVVYIKKDEERAQYVIH